MKTVIGVLNISDRASAGVYDDAPGQACLALLREWLVTPFEMGTGFLASPWLLVTNNHVLPDAATAAGTEVTFRSRRMPAAG